MNKTTPLYNAFLRGEVSEILAGRVNSEDYRSCLSLCENYIPLPQGPLQHRPGTYYVTTGKTDGDAVRLIPYERGAAQSYVIELGDQYMRVYTNGARIESGGSPIEVATPWPKAVLFQLQFAQDDDQLYVVHRGYAPRIIQRTTDDYTWSLTTPTFTGGASAFGSAGNYPGCVTFWQGRLIFASTNNAPQTVWGSEVGTYANFTLGTNADDPWEYTILSNLSETVEWLLTAEDLFAGTSNGVWIFTKGEQAFGGTPDSMGVIRRQSRFGSAPLQAVYMDRRCLYVQKGGTLLRGMALVYERGGYEISDLSVYAPHVLKPGVTCMDVQTLPTPVLWVVRSAGELVAFAFDPESGLFGWARMPMVGSVESVAVIESAGEDQVWLSVAVAINGTTKRFIVYMKPREWGTDQRDCFFVDNGTTVDYGTSYAITGATQTDPVRIACVGHPFATGEHVKIVGVGGMTALNGKYYEILKVDADTFDLYAEDGSDGIDGTFFYLDVASAPAPADFAPGATLTGALSATTCEVFQKESSTRYLCRTRSGAFTDGEDIGDGTNTATGAAGYPVIDDLYEPYTSGGTAQRFEKTISGLSHLEGEEVDMLVDGANHPRRTVSSGEIELQRWGNRLQIGHYTAARMRLMRLNEGGEKGPAIGKKKRIHKAIVGFYQSVGAKVGPDEDHLVEFKWRDPTQAMDAPPELFNGFKEIGVEDSWNTDGWLMVVQDQPMPQMILSVMPFVETREI